MWLNPSRMHRTVSKIIIARGATATLQLLPDQIITLLSIVTVTFLAATKIVPITVAAQETETETIIDTMIQEVGMMITEMINIASLVVKRETLITAMNTTRKG